MKIILDTETTGLQNAEILQLSIINEEGTVLFDNYFKPVNITEWPAAEAVHGISPEYVKDKSQFSDYIEEIQRIINGSIEIIGYNVQFDLRLLQQSGIEINKPIRDVMLDFAPIYGDWNEYHQSYTWKKLVVCADYYNYDWSQHGEAHNALADCYATLHCYNQMEYIERL